MNSRTDKVPGMDAIARHRPPPQNAATDSALISETSLAPDRVRLGIVIPNWNGMDYLLSCLASIRLCRPAPQMTIVVDNGSVDGSAEAIAQDFPEVVLIRNDKNLGFATAINIGAKRAVNDGCEYVLALNNDTEVAPDTLGLMVRAAEQGGVEIVNPLILDRDGHIWFSGATVNRWTAMVTHKRGEVDPSAGPVSIGSASGCAMLVRAWAVRDLGPFDERFFAYYEDCDVSATIRRQGGRIVLEPAAVISHRVSAGGRRNASTAFYYYLFTRNRLLFARRQLGTPWPIFLIRFTAGYVAPRVLILLALGRFRHAEAFIRGYLDFFRGRFGPPQVS